ncbi:MAG: T9SS type A sorting domain-containing protein [Cytophagales bacterium]|nr:T9SS type A sorting domain-containing protein [Cytophagales bacterium]
MKTLEKLFVTTFVNQAKPLMGVLIGIGLTLQSFAQLSEKWVSTYDGNAGRSDKGLAMVIDDKGNSYVTGKSYNGSNYDYATVKYNSAGIERWTASYNGTAYGDDEAIAIAVDDNGNVYVTGKSYNGSSSPYSCENYTQCQIEDAAASMGWILSLVEVGTVDWAMLMDVVYEMCQDGVQDGAVCIENGNYDYATIKYNSKGVEQWVATYNGTGNANDYAKAIGVDNSGNVYVTGNSYGTGTLYDWATVKYDANGIQQWVKRNNGNNGNDAASDLVINDAGNIYVTGQINSSLTTLKYSSSGSVIWGRSDMSGVALDKATAMVLDNIGNVYITGESHVYTNGNYTIIAYITVKYNANGAKQWSAVYNGAANEEPAGIAVDGAGNVYVAGSTYNTYNDDYLIVKYNSVGAQEWAAIYDGSWCSSNTPSNPGAVGYWCVPGDHAKAMTLDADGNVYVTGSSYGSGTNYDIATVKFNANGAEEWVMRYNGSMNQSDDAAAIAVDASGKNVYVSGSVRNSSYNDYVTIKYTSKGSGNGSRINSSLLSMETEVNELKIYPNPTSGEFAVEFNVPETQNIEITLYDVTSRPIYRESFIGFSGTYRKQFDLSNLKTGFAKGIYLLQIISGSEVINKKVLAQ